MLSQIDWHLTEIDFKRSIDLNVSSVRRILDDLKHSLEG